MFITIIFLTFSISEIQSKSNNATFNLKYKWDIVDFTWPSSEMRQNAILTKFYIPPNVLIEGIKIYKKDMYIALPLNRPGVPVTLATAKKNGWRGGILSPFPSWTENLDRKNCSNFQSVQGFEVDSKGVLWVIDAERKGKHNICPCKLVLLDLNGGGKRLHTYFFSNEICLQNGGFFNDIVIDETDGIYAYITDSSVIDPGLVVYSRSENRAWKIRDPSMFPDSAAYHRKHVYGELTHYEGINGIALSPKLSRHSTSQEKMVFYSALTSFDIFSISTKILKNEEVCRGDKWRRNVTLTGKKPSTGDGMIFNEKGHLYYTLTQLAAVGIWNFRKPFSSARILDRNKTSLLVPNGFAFDNTDLYLLGHKIISVLRTSHQNYLQT